MEYRLHVIKWAQWLKVSGTARDAPLSSFVNPAPRRDWQPERIHPTPATAPCATFHISKLGPQLTHNPWRLQAKSRHPSECTIDAQYIWCTGSDGSSRAKGRDLGDHYTVLWTSSQPTQLTPTQDRSPIPKSGPKRAAKLFLEHLFWPHKCQSIVRPTRPPAHAVVFRFRHALILTLSVRFEAVVIKCSPAVETAIAAMPRNRILFFLDTMNI